MGTQVGRRTSRSEDLRALIEPAVAALGYELLGTEFLSAGGGPAVLRVYIDSDTGINVDDCSRVSHQVSGLLDVEDPIAGEYTLEVSSPGFDRPLFTPEHFQRYTGSEVRIKMQVPQDGRRNFRGEIAGCRDGVVHIRLDGAICELPLAQVSQARLVPEE